MSARRTRAAGSALTLLLAAGACGPSETPPPAATAPAATAEPTARATATPAATATAAPAAVGGGDAARGAALYATYCATCHGPRGEGDGPAAAGLDPKPARHSDAAYMGSLSDEHLFRVIKEGGAAVGKSPLMPPWGGSLSDAQIHDLVAFTRSLSRR